LAPYAGNALEVAHACGFLTGDIVNRRVMDITLALGAELLLSAGIEANVETANARLTNTIDSGSAAERFERMVAALGGPADFCAITRSILYRHPSSVPSLPMTMASYRRSAPANWALPSSNSAAGAASR
jgi:thymidine phosphorylase